jgi:hypothetical protein
MDSASVKPRGAGRPLLPSSAFISRRDQRESRNRNARLFSISKEMDTNCCENPRSCNRPGPLDESIDFVGHFAELIPRNISAERILAELRDQQPVAVRVRLHNGGEHAVLIYGCSDRGLGDAELLVWDPARGHRQVSLRSWWTYIGGWQNTCLTKS